jgi:hypothetical protein
MNWKSILLNLGGSAAAAFGAVVASAPAGTTPDGKTISTVVIGAVIANAIGLFQTAPHQGGK